MWKIANIGIQTGRSSGLVVIDVDPRHSGHDSWCDFAVTHSLQSPMVKRYQQAVQFQSVTPRQQDYYIPPEDVVLRLKAMAERPDPVYYRLALLMVHTGLRIGEATELCWDAVEVDGDKGPARHRVVRILSWDYMTKAPYLVGLTLLVTPLQL